jgi:hypothetical protein
MIIQVSKLLLYISIRHNLLYIAWADRPGMYMDILYIKYKKKLKLETYICIYHLTQIKTVTHYMTSLFLTGRMPHDKQNCYCLDYNQLTNQPIDWLSNSCKVTLTLTLILKSHAIPDDWDRDDSKIVFSWLLYMAYGLRGYYWV